MKRILTIISAALLMVGCAGVPTTQEITALASTGTSTTLIVKPDYRPAFQASSVALGGLSKTNALTIADIQSALSSVNVNGANTPVVAASIGNILALINAFGAPLSSLPASNQLTALQGLALALQTGINQGLAMTITNPPPSTP